jgi:hypothetical protein
MTANVLNMWTVYDHPEDFPHTFVARRWEVGSGTVVSLVMTDDMIIAPELEGIRKVLRLRGLVRLERHPNDDERIVETWI